MNAMGLCYWGSLLVHTNTVYIVLIRHNLLLFSTLYTLNRGAQPSAIYDIIAVRPTPYCRFSCCFPSPSYLFVARMNLSLGPCDSHSVNNPWGCYTSHRM